MIRVSLPKVFLFCTAWAIFVFLATAHWKYLVESEKVYLPPMPEWMGYAGVLLAYAMGVAAVAALSKRWIAVPVAMMGLLAGIAAFVLFLLLLGTPTVQIYGTFGSFLTHLGLLLATALVIAVIVRAISKRISSATETTIPTPTH